MKIRFVTPWYGEFAGGAEVAARKLAENLFSEGVDVEILTTCCRTPFEDWWADYYIPGKYKINKVPVLRFPTNKESADLYHLVNHKIINRLPVSKEDELNFMRGNINSHALIAHIKQNRDCYYVFIPYLYGPAVWGINALPERSILIPCLHDEPIAKWEIVRGMFIKARKVIFLSEEERVLASHLYSADMSAMPVLGVGVDTDISHDGKRFRGKYGIKDRFIVYAGRKDRGKNVLLLIDYFKHYLDLHPSDLKLVFIGGGDPSLVPINDTYFTDLGYIPEQDKYDAMAASIAVCNLSENESFSFVLMEGWLAGRPAIVSSKGSVTSGHCLRSKGGFPVSDADEFCTRLHQLVRDDILSREMGSSGRGYVLGNYTWDKVLSRYIETFKELG